MAAKPKGERLKADPQECRRIAGAYAATMAELCGDISIRDGGKARARQLAVVSHDAWYRVEAFHHEHNLSGLDEESLLIDLSTMLAGVNAIALMATRAADCQFAEIHKEGVYVGPLTIMQDEAWRIAGRAGASGPEGED